MEKLDKMGQKGQKGEKHAAQHPAPPQTARGHCSRAQRPAAAPPRTQRVFAPFSTCSRPHDVMLTSSMTSQCPLRVFSFLTFF